MGSGGYDKAGRPLGEIGLSSNKEKDLKKRKEAGRGAQSFVVSQASTKMKLLQDVSGI